MSRVDELIQMLCPGGVVFKTLSEVTLKGTNIKWAQARDEEFQYIDLTSVDRVTKKIGETATISAVDAPSRAQQIVREGDVIFATTRPTQMRWALIPAEYDGQIASTGYCVLRPIQAEVLTNFLAHLLGAERFRKYVEEKQIPGNYPSIPDSLVRAFRIPIPPIEVQREIVKVLDTFSKLEAELEAELEARRKQYTFYRDQLLTSSDRIRWAKVGEISNLSYGFTAKAADEGEYRFIRITDITENGKLSPEGAKFVDSSNGAGEYVVEPGDVLMARTGATFGKTVLIENDKPAVYASFLIRIRVKHDEVLPAYYWHFAQSTQYWQQANNLVSRGGQPQFNANVLKDIRIPVPPIEEQARVVALLDRFDAIVNDLNSGLPAELNARRKQYEHYRDRLLTFQEAT